MFLFSSFFQTVIVLFQSMLSDSIQLTTTLNNTFYCLERPHLTYKSMASSSCQAGLLYEIWCSFNVSQWIGNSRVGGIGCTLRAHKARQDQAAQRKETFLCIHEYNFRQRGRRTKSPEVNDFSVSSSALLRRLCPFVEAQNKENKQLWQEKVTEIRALTASRFSRHLMSLIVLIKVTINIMLHIELIKNTVITCIWMGPLILITKCIFFKSRELLASVSVLRILLSLIKLTLITLKAQFWVYRFGKPERVIPHISTPFPASLCLYISDSFLISYYTAYQSCVLHLLPHTVIVTLCCHRPKLLWGLANVF